LSRSFFRALPSSIRTLVRALGITVPFAMILTGGRLTAAAETVTTASSLGRMPMRKVLIWFPSAAAPAAERILADARRVCEAVATYAKSCSIRI
jgi:hypothetical protein